MTIRECYSAGYSAAKRLQSYGSNPHSSLCEMKKHCAWAAGFNDCKMGYPLDLRPFNYK